MSAATVDGATDLPGHQLLCAADPVRRLVTAPTATIRTTATLREAAHALAADSLGLLVVVDPDAVRGVISERDLVRAMADGADLDEERIGDHTSEELVSVDGAVSILAAAAVMTDAQVRHLVVSRRGQVVGVVSIRDLLAVLVAEEARPPHGAAAPGSMEEETRDQIP